MSTINIVEKFAKLKFGINARLHLYEQIKAMLAENIPIVDAVGSLKDIYKSENKRDYRVYILGEWHKSLKNSGSLIKEIKNWIPENEVVMFQTAEETGKWAECLENLIFLVSKQSEIKKAVFSQMAYPGFLTVLLVGILYGFGAKGVPMLSQMLDPMRWPSLAKPLYDISTGVQSNILFIIAGLGVSLYIIFKIQNKYVGGARDYLDKIPPYNIYKSMQGASFLISLASLMKSGIPVADAVDIISQSASPWVKKKIRKIKGALDKGGTGGRSLIAGGQQGMFGPEIRIQVKAFGSLSQLDRAMHVIGLRAIDITTSYVSKMCGLIKAVMMLAVALFIVWMYVAFMLVSQAASSSLQ